MDAATKSKQNKINKIGLTTIFTLCNDKWGLDNEEVRLLLGSPSKRTYFNWKSNPEKANLSKDQLERISYILNIHASLRIIFNKSKDSTYNWIKKKNSNPMFNNKSALDLMLGGQVIDLYKVNQFLNAQRGIWT